MGLDPASEDTRERCNAPTARGFGGKCEREAGHDGEHGARSMGEVIADARAIEAGYKPSVYAVPPAEDTRERAAQAIRAILESDETFMSGALEKGDLADCLADVVLAVVSPSPVDAGQRCEFCGEPIEGDVFERWGLPFCDEKHAGKCNPDEMDDPNDEGHWVAAPPVGVDEEQLARDLDDLHFLHGDKIVRLAFATEGLERVLGLDSLEAVKGTAKEALRLATTEPDFAAARPSSTAPGVTGAMIEALRFYAAEETWVEMSEVPGEEPDHFGGVVMSDRDKGARARAALAVSPAPTEGPDDA